MLMSRQHVVIYVLVYMHIGEDKYRKLPVNKNTSLTSFLLQNRRQLPVFSSNNGTQDCYYTVRRVFCRLGSGGRYRQKGSLADKMPRMVNFLSLLAFTVPAAIIAQVLC